MTTLRLNEDVSVEDRAAECLTAITALYDDGMAHVAFLSRAWEAPPLPSAPALLAAALAEPVGSTAPTPPVATVEPPTAGAVDDAAAEPAVPPTELPAVLPADVVAEAPTDTELPVATLEEPGTELIQVGDREVLDEGRVLVLADAVTAEIPVQKAA